MAAPQAVTGEGLEPRTPHSLFNRLGHGIGIKSLRSNSAILANRAKDRAFCDLCLGEPQLQCARRLGLRGRCIRNANAVACHSKAALRSLHEHASEMTSALVIAWVR